MTLSMSALLERTRQIDPHQTDFHQAVEEVLESIVPVAAKNKSYLENGIVDRLLEPDRTFRFRVTWEDDDGLAHVNRGWRVQHSNALGPYKGGMRFHPTVNVGVLKFLAFEQTFKNALTGLPLGAGKGGSDFDPKGRSDREVMRFCQSFMTQLWRQLGPETDVPAGDIGVGAREVGYMFGQYKRLAGHWVGVLTGKGGELGGIALRTEATGFGLVLFAMAMMRQAEAGTMEGKRVAVSGAGNVALHAAQKLIDLNAKVVTLSDSKGYLRIPDGMDRAALDVVRRIKLEERKPLSDAASGIKGAEFLEGARPWSETVDIALPSATQNEMNGDEASMLVENGCQLVAEGANMPCTPEAVSALREAGVLFGPAKAANAGGVAVSGLEMAQNADKQVWERDRVESELEAIMQHIHDLCVADGAPSAASGDRVDYVRGANVAGFRRVANAMVSTGLA